MVYYIAFSVYGNSVRMRGMGKIKLVMGIDVNGNDALFPPEGNFRALAARTTVDLQVVRYK